MNNSEFYKALASAVSGGGALIYTALSGESFGQKAFFAGGKLLVQNNELRPLWQKAVEHEGFTTASLPCTAQLLGTKVFAENILPMPRLVVCGGGHISLPLVQIATLLGFETTVIDDREEFANSVRFPTAQQVICTGFEAAFGQLAAPVANTYYVIITRGHSADRECLEEILHRNPNAAYIGMIGSKHKVAVVMEQMLADGYTPQQLERIHAPIGLKIGAQTPAEIAVCIAAQLVQVRSERANDGAVEEEMLALLAAGSQPMVMATILTKKGSAPRVTGAKMLLNAEGRVLCGSVGGGAGEGQICGMAGEVIKNGTPQITTCSMTNDDAKKEGMVCGGTITVLLEAIL